MDIPEEAVKQGNLVGLAPTAATTTTTTTEVVAANDGGSAVM